MAQLEKPGKSWEKLDTTFSGEFCEYLVCLKVSLVEHMHEGTQILMLSLDIQSELLTLLF